MANYRVTIFIIITIGILLTTIILIQVGKGYRPDISNGTLTSTGLLSADSDPKGAQVYIDGVLITATDDTISLEPNEYQVQIKKDGFIPWTKTIQVEKELVAQTNATLFPLVPDLKALTYTGTGNPKLSPNGTRIIYTVTEPTIPDATPSATTTPSNVNNTTSSTPSAQIKTNNSQIEPEKIGLWMIELSDLPLGFSRDPQQLVSGESTEYRWNEGEFIWSPDSREVLAVFRPQTTNTTNEPQPVAPNRVYRIQLNQLVKFNQLTNVATGYEQIIDDWDQDAQDKITRQLSALPLELNQLLSTASADIKFSPDETKIMYTATASAQLANQYLPPVLASNSQPQSRILVPGGQYVYDTKEDLNFQIDTLPLSNDNSSPTENSPHTEYTWFPTSHHLIKSQINQITILEYDNTNHATVYSSSLPIQVFPHPSSSKLIVLTTLNPLNSPTPNLYTLVLR